MTQAIVYRRASTDELTQVHSLDRQSYQIEEFAKRHGYEIIGVFEEYVSAFQGTARPQFRKALARLEENPEMVLIVHDLTRLSRSLQGYSSWMRHLERIRFASLGDNVMSPLQAELLLVISSNESRELGSRISSGIAAKKDREGSDFKWGFDVNGAGERARAASMRSNKAKALSSAEKIVAAVQFLESQGVTQRARQIERLDGMGIRSSRGKRLSRMAIQRAFKRVEAETTA